MEKVLAWAVGISLALWVVAVLLWEAGHPEGVFVLVAVLMAALFLYPFLRLFRAIIHRLEREMG